MQLNSQYNCFNLYILLFLLSDNGMNRIGYPKPGTNMAPVPIGAFPLHGTARHGSVRFAFPLQFSTALEWPGLFTSL